VSAAARASADGTGGARLPDGVPDLDDVAGEWVDAADLAHLPSLRNQYGQGHVNYDLSSMSWLAAPPEPSAPGRASPRTVSRNSAGRISPRSC
jgi:hypothetical protein